jgi:hypothetical protein
MFEKDAGGEFIGGLAGLLARPVAGAAGSAALRNKIVGGLTTHVSDPLERLLHRVGAGKAVEDIARAAAVPVPKSWPLVGRLSEKSLSIPEGVPLLGGKGSIPYLPTPEARAAWAKTKAHDTINTIAQHPDAAAFSAATTLMAPIPGITEAYLGAKHYATKGMNRLVPSMAASPPPAPVSSRPMPSLSEEPMYLKWPPSAKEASAYLQGSRAGVEKYALTLAELLVLGIPAGAGIGAGVGALRAEPGHRGMGALKGGLTGAGVGVVPLGLGVGALGGAYAMDAMSKTTKFR